MCVFPSTDSLTPRCLEKHTERLRVLHTGLSLPQDKG